MAAAGRKQETLFLIRPRNMKRSLFYGAATLRIDHVTEAGISRVCVCVVGEVEVLGCLIAQSERINYFE